MKRVLVIGSGSYIGSALANYAKDRLAIEMIGGRNGVWKQTEFRGYDSVVLCAGIAHRKDAKKYADLYFQVNRDMAYAIAQKAKTEGVPHFVYLSSLSVYGRNSGHITQQTVPAPRDYYGQSKYEAEKLLCNLADETFSVAVIRPPMVYGPACKGNFPRLVKLAGLLPVFPDVQNQRSMIYIDNLSEFLVRCIDQRASGTYCPQNAQTVCTTELVREIQFGMGRHIRVSKLFGRMVPLFMMVSSVEKLFGSLVCEDWIEAPLQGYQIMDFPTSVRQSLRG